MLALVEGRIIILRPEGVRFGLGDGGAGVAGGDKFFQAEGVKINREVLKEVGLVRVVAVAKDGFAREVPAVVAQFLFDIFDTGIEFVFASLSRRVEIFIFSHSVAPEDFLAL